MDAALLYKMLKRRSKHVIKLQREDFLFLYCVENDLRLDELTNEPDDDQNLPFDFSLSSAQLNIAKLLVEHKAFK
uniref:Uncharacterized protein n=1 Tax=Panagrolaimus davidi TaxID=227884 RepID=A0A914R0Y7_9BILA